MTRKKYFFVVSMFLWIYCCIKLIGLYTFPEEIKLIVNQEKTFDYNLPMEVKLSAGIQNVLQVNQKKIPRDKISLNLNHPFTLSSSETGHFEVELNLLGGLFNKDITLEVLDNQDYIPCGNMIGVTLYTDGILVLGTGNFTDEANNMISPSEGKLLTGDYILSVDGEGVKSNSDLVESIQESKGSHVIVEFRRNDQVQTTEITPYFEQDQQLYKIGIWVRDSTQGIGTLTFVNPSTNCFGALGHGVSDIDSESLIELSSGSIVTSIATTITKGKKGDPGEVSGIIEMGNQEQLGTINRNTKNGLYGELSQKGIEEFDHLESLSIGLKHEIKLGEATVRSNISGEMKEYTIEIEKIFINESSNKSMIIRVTDNELLDLTNGIVQGMSGSPIIQDGKLVGAITHVFVQDSTKGYGTFIENMLLEEREEP